MSWQCVFKHPLIRRAIIDYMPSGYQAYAFLVSYGTVTGENGDIPKGGSLAMSLRIAERYKRIWWCDTYEYQCENCLNR